MSLLVDYQIRRLCVDEKSLPIKQPMIEPFSESVQGGGVISFGLSHAGYDLRLGRSVKVFKNTFGKVVDPKLFGDVGYQHKVFDEVGGLEDHKQVLIPANGYILAHSLEYIRIPRFLKGRCVGKSTLARCGVIVNTTPLEPGWCGHLTIEIANSTPCQVAVYACEGIAQLEFEMLNGSPAIDYAEKAGKYQGQKAEPVPAKVKE